jgi:hypothetical protein
MIPVPPRANPEGIWVTIEIMYGKEATTAKKGAPIQFTRFNTLAICFSVSFPVLTPGINLPDFSKFSAKFSGFIWM